MAAAAVSGFHTTPSEGESERAAAARQAVLAERFAVGALLFGAAAFLVWSFVAMAAAAWQTDALQAVAFGLPVLTFVVVQGSSGIGIVLAVSARRRAAQLGAPDRRARIALRLSGVVFGLCGTTFLYASGPLLLTWAW